jgi:hypothetical protein
MEDQKGYDDIWIETGFKIAEGGQLSMSDLKAIYENLELHKINPTYLPGPYTVAGTASMRKEAIFTTARNLWGIEPEKWLEKERKWLIAAREVFNLPESTGKDKLDDVISAEIVVRIVAAANLAIKVNGEGLLYRTEVADEAVFALNVLLMEVCAKGRTRSTRIDDNSVYSILKDGGLMIGAGGGKYLPHPTYSLPQLFMLLRREKLRPEIYLS